MRLLTPRRVAVTALCAALTLGTAGPALAHATHQAAAKEQVNKQVKAPEDIGDILGSIGSVLDAVLGTVSGTNSNTQTLPATDMNQQMKDLTAAIEALRKAVAEAEANSGPATSAPAPAPAGNSVDSADTTDAAVDKALAGMDKAIDDMVAAAMKGQAATSASQVQTATKALIDAIMRDVAEMTGTQATGVSTLPATVTQQMPADGL